MRYFIAGNWKMNGTPDALAELAEIADKLSPDVDTMICPPATLIYSAAQQIADSALMIGGQTCHANVSGAHTGDISAEMLAAAGASAVIIGHSERRADHRETDKIVNAQCRAAWRAGLTAILCIGETEGQYLDGKTLDICGDQLNASLPEGATPENTVIAYEPVWAIGTGRVPDIADIAKVHDHIRTALTRHLGGGGAEIRLLYGGSVKADNADEILAIDNVNGALVGGASLKAATFMPIVDAAAKRGSA